MTCVGMGKEVGCTLSQNKEMFLGLFLAPDIVANAKKTADFAAALFSLLGFECFPDAKETRGDIITVVKLGEPELLKAFCCGIQKGAPVDSFLTPEPWDMPGYENQVIMAAGAFNMGGFNRAFGRRSAERALCCMDAGRNYIYKRKNRSYAGSSGNDESRAYIIRH